MIALEAVKETSKEIVRILIRMKKIEAVVRECFVIFDKKKWSNFPITNISSIKSKPNICVIFSFCHISLCF